MSTFRIQILTDDSPLAERVARRGGRVFGLGSTFVVTLPDAAGDCVVVPRGFGNPLLARRSGEQVRVLGSGAPCHPARWALAGGVVARVRDAGVPCGPAVLLVAEGAPADESGADESGRWMWVRTEPLAWAAARISDPALASSCAAVVGASGRLAAVSERARAAGLVPGMALSVALRRCSNLRCVESRGVAALEANVLGALARSFVGVRRERGGWVMPIGHGVDALKAGADLVRLLWQRTGVAARAAVADDLEDARALAGVLPTGLVGEVPAGLVRAWRTRGTGSFSVTGGKARWSGVALPDLEGALARSRGLAARLRGPVGALRVRVDGARGQVRVRVHLPPRADARTRAALVDAALRGRLYAVGAVQSVSVGRCVGAAAAPADRTPAVRPRSRQLSLLPAVRS